MSLLPPNTRVRLAVGYTDMRKGIDGLAMLVQEALGHDPFLGHLFVFHGRKANQLEIVYWDGPGVLLFIKRLEQGAFLGTSITNPGGTVPTTSQQLANLIDGIDWRAPEQRWRPAAAG